MIFLSRNGVYFQGFGAYQTSANPNNYHLSLAVSTGLTGLMGYRYISPKKM